VNRGQIGWIMGTIDNSTGVQFLYAETGEVINAQKKQIVGQLMDPLNNPVSSRYGLEVDFSDGLPSRAGNQFAVGQ
jgi:hypothetical protein